jgi:Fe-S cluster assembly protein SufD
MTAITKDINSEIIEAFQQQHFEVALESRDQAIEYFQKKGLPSTKQEEYRFTPLTRALEKNFTWHELTTSSTVASVQEYLIPDLNANVVVMINGVYSSSLSRIISPSREVIISSLSIP